MQKRKLGKSGLEIAPLMFGGNVFGWTVDEATSFKLLDAFVGAGFDAIDTADVYSKWVPGHKGGESEIIIGKWLKARGNREQGRHRHQGRHGDAGPRPGPAQGLHHGARRGLAEAPADRLHRPLPVARRRQGDAARGDARHLPDSSSSRARCAPSAPPTTTRRASPKRSRRAPPSKLPRYETLQPLYNLSERADFEKELQPLCVKEDVGVIPYYALASRLPHRQVPDRRPTSARARAAAASRST